MSSPVALKLRGVELSHHAAPRKREGTIGEPRRRWRGSGQIAHRFVGPPSATRASPWPVSCIDPRGSFLGLASAVWTVRWGFGGAGEAPSNPAQLSVSLHLFRSMGFVQSATGRRPAMGCFVGSLLGLGRKGGSAASHRTVVMESEENDQPAENSSDSAGSGAVKRWRRLERNRVVPRPSKRRIDGDSRGRPGRDQGSVRPPATVGARGSAGNRESVACSCLNSTRGAPVRVGPRASGTRGASRVAVALVKGVAGLPRRQKEGARHHAFEGRPSVSEGGDALQPTDGSPSSI